MRSGKASNIPGDAQDPTPLQILQEALAIAKFEPGIYEVVQTFAPVGDPQTTTLQDGLSP